MYPYVKRKTENLGKCNTKSMLSFERECGFKPTASRTARKLIFIILSHQTCGNITEAYDTGTLLLYMKII